MLLAKNKREQWLWVIVYQPKVPILLALAKYVKVNCPVVELMEL